jgi:nucleoside-diphosphate-sugar epimerase
LKKISELTQIVVYGANGWLGRSTVEAIMAIAPKIHPEKILLIGSKFSEIHIRGKDFEILDPILGEARIKNGAIFVNCAFLRSEFIKRCGESGFIARNLEIMALPARALRNSALFSFVNLSSGTAALADQNSNKSPIDAYSILKRKSELDFEQETKKVGTNFINCRIYSVSGRYLNEFENLALSAFISRALKGDPIRVNSPHSMRTYIDGVDLMTLVLNLAIHGESVSFDSGGTLISMLNLAETVNKVVGQVNMDVSVGIDGESSYFGDYEGFNRMAASINHNLLSIEDQIANTINAFK